MARVTRTLNGGSAALWASAMVIFALVIMQTGRTDYGGMTLADVAQVQDLTIATFNAGGGEQGVAILDRREEKLFVYMVENLRVVEMQVAEDVRFLFTQAAAQAAGRR